MITFKINIDYKVNREGKDNMPSNSDLTLDYISYATTAKYKDGLEGQLRRIFGRIQRKIDEAIEGKKESIELEDAEFDFIAKLFSEGVKFPATAAKYVTILEDQIDALVTKQKGS